MNHQLHAELDYCVPLGIPHSEFLSWDQDDQDKAVAYQAEMRKVCGQCGTRPEEWEQDRFAYVGELRRCPGCEILAQENDNVPKEARGVHAHLRPRPFDDEEDGDAG